MAWPLTLPSQRPGRHTQRAYHRAQGIKTNLNTEEDSEIILPKGYIVPKEKQYRGDSLDPSVRNNLKIKQLQPDDSPFRQNVLGKKYTQKIWIPYSPVKRHDEPHIIMIIMKEPQG